MPSPPSPSSWIKHPGGGSTEGQGTSGPDLLFGHRLVGDGGTLTVVPDAVCVRRLGVPLDNEGEDSPWVWMGAMLDPTPGAIVTGPRAASYVFLTWFGSQFVSTQIRRGWGRGGQSGYCPAPQGADAPRYFLPTVPPIGETGAASVGMYANDLAYAGPHTTEAAYAAAARPAAQGRGDQ